MSQQSSNKLFTDILIGLIVTVFGGVLVAWYIKEGERFQPSQPTTVSIAVTSHYCNAQDFYVDGEKVISSINPNSTVAFKTSSGDHWVYYCSPMTSICGESVLINWDKASSYIIEKDTRCPITITLSNEFCTDQDYYVDENLVVSAIAPNSTVAFEIIPGEHETVACMAGTNNCGNKLIVTWTTSTIQRIVDKSSLCPITITLSNEFCTDQDYYVDGNLVLSAIPPNSTANFEITPGEHETVACTSGTNYCGEKLVITWTTSTIQRIVDKNSECP